MTATTLTQNIKEINVDIPLFCEVCKSGRNRLFPDTQFNNDMKRNNIGKMRFACMHDHGIVIEFEAPDYNREPKIRCCHYCGSALAAHALPQTIYHQTCAMRLAQKNKHPAKKFKSGIYEEV